MGWCSEVVPCGGPIWGKWKSKIFLETSPVTINDEDFDHWVGNYLDISLRPLPVGTPQALAGTAGN
jgi:hypothetical protein